ncbi:MAG TPA: amidohydrolase family protein [Candidatus Polarisedimenticolia bacterium]|jgi:predicted TIM-barrel fold metal-dependent hydrolase|nr:amidohydrolase family protein [Candidatus Polarisedimenticolia bacterium]
MSSAPHRIDVHHHIVPSEYVKAAKAAGAKDAGGVTFPAWSPEAQLELMDRRSIATAMTSIAAPGVYFGNRDAARSLAHRSNELSARLVADHPRRFGALAVLPLPDVDAALEELAYALDTLDMDGVALLASIGDRYLGDPAFDTLFDELHRRKSVLFIHPTIPESSQFLKLAMPAALIEFVFDTTRAVANLIFSGTIERCPDISIILPHAGGTVPYLTGRLSLGALVPSLHAKAPRGAAAYLKRFYYETALSTEPTTLSSLKELVDPSHILFGSDYPFAPEPLIESEIRGLVNYGGFDEPTRRAIERDNSLALFPRLRDGSAAGGRS